ncbi:MAG: hypothetical protein R3C05_00560 [Pirellulaceae bacterium]
MTRLLKFLPIALLLPLLIAGCKAGPQLSTARDQFYLGQLVDSRSTYEAVREDDKKCSVLCDLDLAMVELATGEVESAQQRLLSARDTLDENQAASIVDGTFSYITDDRVRDYKGWGYEQVMIRAMLAMSSLMHDAFDAEAFALQAASKQAELQRRSEEAGFLDAGTSYQPLAFAPYIRGMLREATYHDYDDAVGQYRLVAEMRPTFAPASFDIQRAESGTHSPPDCGVLYVFAFVGRGPQRVAERSQVTSDVLLAADRIVSAIGKYSVPPTMAPIQIPAVAVPAVPVDTLFVMANNQPLGLTQSITDVGEMAMQQFEAEKKELLVRAVARRVVKKSAVAAGKDVMGIEDPALQLIIDLAGSAWEATEKPDLRCWQLLPRDIQVLRAELPVGTHDIRLQAFGTGSPLHLDAMTQTVDIQDGRNTYVLATAPTDRVIAAISR